MEVGFRERIRLVEIDAGLAGDRVLEGILEVLLGGRARLPVVRSVCCLMSMRSMASGGAA
jgi:hypothetical protein